jgi:hypothetical protein
MKKVRVALGVGALAPAALALAPAAAHAATRSVTCGTAPNHWTEFKDGGSITCAGYNGGTWHLSRLLLASKECGGNNYGWYSIPLSGRHTFHEGTTFAALPGTDGGIYTTGVSAIHISGWSRTDTCN